MTPDFIKCVLFPFSLADKASRWLNSLITGSLTSLEQVRSAFLGHTNAKTAALQNKISSFQQHVDDPFCDAWERFSEYCRECSHHGLDDDHIVRIFCDGVDWEYHTAMNSASKGEFMTQTIDVAFELIENMAASSANKCQEHDQTRMVTVLRLSGEMISLQKLICF